MIRRGFWLVAGAVLGVTGYRKATRLARTLTRQGLLGGPNVTRQRPALRLHGIRAGQIGRAQLQQAQLQQARSRRALPGQWDSGQPFSEQPDSEQRDARPNATPAARIAAAAAHATAAAGFVRDIRDGMAEYWDLHRSESDRTLGSQRDRTWSGDS